MTKWKGTITENQRKLRFYFSLTNDHLYLPYFGLPGGK